MEKKFMPQGIQNQMPTQIMRDNACFMLCLLKYLELNDEFQYESVQQIETLYKAAIQLGLVAENTLVLDICKFMNFADGGDKYHRVIRDLPAPTELCVVKLQKPNYTHYVLEYKGCRWDPLDPQRPAALEYKPVSYEEYV